MQILSVTIIRFIAGAICPSCGAQDSIKMYIQDNEKMFECVDCSYSDVQKSSRVFQENKQSDAIKKDNGVQIVRILDNKSH